MASMIAKRGFHYLKKLEAASISTALIEKGQDRVIDASLTLIRERAKLKGELVRALGGAKAATSLLGVPLGHNSSFLQGPAFAPPRIREAIWCGSTNATTEEGKELNDPRVLTDVGDVPVQEIRDCGVEDDRLMDVISQSVKLVMEQDPLRPLVLGGDHSISFPVVRAVSEKLGGPVDILHLDAHPDIYHAFEGNKYSHASSFARIMEGGYARRLLQVGIRSITSEGREQGKKFGVEQYEMRTFSSDRQNLENLKLGEGVKGVYISVDVDCLDPAFAPGVSHIEPGGLSFRDVLNILHNLQADVVAADVVEFNPQRDTVDGMTAMVAAKLTLSSTISRLSFLRRPSFCYPYNQLAARRATWSPPNLSSLSNRMFCSKNGGQLDVSCKENLIVLGIETSCDDTAAAVVRGNGEILSQVVSSQADLLVQYGGVAPKMAEEAHLLAIDPVVREALDKAKLTESDLSAVAVTIGPGLSLCLRVGVQKARKIAGRFNLPVVGVHHMEAHAIVARLIEQELQFPFLALLISGGHNLLVLAHDLGQYTQLGTTIDDAIGEAFDKTAKWLGLDMRRSGGPAVEELALEGDAESVKFSTPMKQHKDCNFSYAGLKTQVRLAIESRNIDAKIPISSASSQDRSSRADVAASFQRVAVLHLEERCERAIEWALKIEPSIKHLVVSGGVASNKYVRARLDQVVKKNSLQLVCPPPSLCTDNGVMVAWTGIENFCMGRYDPPPPADDPEDFVYDLRPRWPLGEEYAEGRSEARSMRKARIHPSLTSLVQDSKHQYSNSHGPHSLKS